MPALTVTAAVHPPSVPGPPSVGATSVRVTVEALSVVIVLPTSVLDSHLGLREERNRRSATCSAAA